MRLSSFLQGDGVPEPGGLRFKFYQPPLRGQGDDPGLDGLHEVGRGPLILGELIPQAQQHGGIRLPLLVGHDRIRHPLDDLRLQNIVQGGLHHHPLQPIPAHVGL